MPQEVQPSSQFPRDNVHSCPSPLSATVSVPAGPVASSEVSASVPAGPVASSEVSASVPATTVTTTRSGRVIKKPLRFDC